MDCTDLSSPEVSLIAYDTPLDFLLSTYFNAEREGLYKDVSPSKEDNKTEFEKITETNFEK